MFYRFVVYLVGDAGSSVHGFVNTGIFQGTITLSNRTTYIVERIARWMERITPKSNRPHSVIYVQPKREANRERTNKLVTTRSDVSVPLMDSPTAIYRL